MSKHPGTHYYSADHQHGRYAKLRAQTDEEALEQSKGLKSSMVIKVVNTVLVDNRPAPKPKGSVPFAPA